MNIPSNPSSSLSFPFGDPNTVQTGLAAAGTAVTTVASAPVVATLATVAAVAGVCYAGYKFIKWLDE